MKHISVIISILFTVMFSMTLFAQSRMENRLGIGISIDPTRIGHVTYYTYGQNSFIVETATNQSPILFYLPINVTDKIRIEPLFGLNSTSNASTSNTTNNIGTNSTKHTYSSDATAVTIGVSGFYRTSLSNYFGLYFGPRVSYTFLSLVNENKNESIYGGGNHSSSTYNTKTNETDITVGLAFGVEYFPISRISFGGEASFNYTSFGNPHVKNTFTPPQPSNSITTVERTRHSSHTDGIFFVRWYFL
ncbi:MAG TPA: hypothetical protein ENI76_01290 [Ignavibacteria bacterium]|nr:hypothetical protein [Ignavibacteria bacterium]